MRAYAEHDVHAQPDQLGHPKAGLDGGEQQGVVALAEEGAAVGRGQEGLDLVIGEE